VLLLLLDVPILSFHFIELSTLSVQLDLFFVHACDLLLHIVCVMLVLSLSLHLGLTALCPSHVSCLTASEGQNVQVQYMTRHKVYSALVPKKQKGITNERNT